MSKQTLDKKRELIRLRRDYAMRLLKEKKEIVRRQLERRTESYLSPEAVLEQETADAERAINEAMQYDVAANIKNAISKQGEGSNVGEDKDLDTSGSSRHRSRNDVFGNVLDINDLESRIAVGPEQARPIPSPDSKFHKSESVASSVVDLQASVASYSSAVSKSAVSEVPSDIVEDRPGYKSGHEVEEVLTEASDFSTAYTEDYEDTFEDDQAAGGAADDLLSNRNESTLYEDDSFVPEESNASLVSTVVDSSIEKGFQAIKSLRGELRTKKRMLKQIKRDAIKSRQVAELEGLRKELMRVEQEISAEVKTKEHKSVYVPAASKTTRVSIGSEERSGVSISIKEEDGEGSSDDSEPGEAEDANDVVGLADSPKEKEEDDDNDEGVYSSFADPELSIATELEESIASQSGQESIPAPAPPSAESKRSHNHHRAPQCPYSPN